MTITSVPVPRQVPDDRQVTAAHAWQPGRRCTELPCVALASPSVPRWMRLNSICAVATTMATPNEDALLLHPRGAQHVRARRLRVSCTAARTKLRRSPRLVSARSLCR